MPASPCPWQFTCLLPHREIRKTGHHCLVTSVTPKPRRVTLSHGDAWLFAEQAVGGSYFQLELTILGSSSDVSPGPQTEMPFSFHQGQQVVTAHSTAGGLCPCGPPSHHPPWPLSGPPTLPLHPTPTHFAHSARTTFLKKPYGQTPRS